jgi:hypothetical protein
MYMAAERGICAKTRGLTTPRVLRFGKIEWKLSIAFHAIVGFAEHLTVSNEM